MLSSKEKKMLRSMGHHLEAELWIGKDGISNGTITTLDNSFNTKDLVKVKIQESCPLEKSEVAKELTEKSNSELVQIKGRTLLLFRQLVSKKDVSKEK